jgi:ATP-dependent helicase Lhr and Lhr-like helicase
MSFDLAQAVEQVLVSGDARLRLSRRSSSRIGELTDLHRFVDGDALPIIAEGEASVRLWSFAGGRANAMLAAALAAAGARVRSRGNFSITTHARDPEQVAMLGAIEPDTVPTPIPRRAVAQLKFGVCLRPTLADAVISARLADVPALKCVLRRPRHVVRLA